MSESGIHVHFMTWIVGVTHPSRDGTRWTQFDCQCELTAMLKTWESPQVEQLQHPELKVSHSHNNPMKCRLSVWLGALQQEFWSYIVILITSSLWYQNLYSFWQWTHHQNQCIHMKDYQLVCTTNVFSDYFKCNQRTHSVASISRDMAPGTKNSSHPPHRKKALLLHVTLFGILGTFPCLILLYCTAATRMGFDCTKRMQKWSRCKALWCWDWSYSTTSVPTCVTSCNACRS